VNVIPLALNQLSLQELNQLIRIKLLIQVFKKFLVFSLNLQMEGMPVSPLRTPITVTMHNKLYI